MILVIHQLYFTKVTILYQHQTQELKPVSSNEIRLEVTRRMQRKRLIQQATWVIDSGL